MRLALDFKNNEEKIINDLKEKGYEVSKSSLNSYWIDNLKYAIIVKKRIEICGKAFCPYTIDMEDIENLEVHSN